MHTTWHLCCCCCRCCCDNHLSGPHPHGSTTSDTAAWSTRAVVPSSDFWLLPATITPRKSVCSSSYLSLPICHLSIYPSIYLSMYPFVHLSIFLRACSYRQTMVPVFTYINIYLCISSYIYKHVTLCKPSSVSITANCNLFTRRREPWRLETLTDFFACQATYIALFRTPLFRTTSEDKKGPVGQNTCCKH